METLTKSEVQIRAEELIERIHAGEVFVHPTDTIYGIGCNAQDERAVKKVRKLKERKDAPFSIWAPSKAWIKEQCAVTKEGEKWIEKLPGPYTLVFKLKNKNAIAPSVCMGADTVGVRIPHNWFHRVVELAGVPIITTSANRTGKQFMTSLENLDKDIKNGVRFIVYEGEKSGKPSNIVHLADKVKVVERTR
ncbi:MAG TPA: L-threonylcarbamoyladenylate synthase [Candidatus Nanoarchaeia archaeon]|nr:L-threonylcarbamoyladenylate synthase [Candidatus Nanoarchaeia archaeon]